MGIKSLSLQVIPWCFHVMGNAADCDHPDPPALCVRLIGADGRVKVYHRQVSAGELMKEHPIHLVCRSDTFTIGQRIPALAEGDQLQPGHSYFLLPLHLFQSVLSFVTLASSFARAAATSSSSNGSASSPLLQRRLLEVHKTPSGKLQIRVSDDFIRRIQEAQQEAGDGGGGGGAPGQGSGGGGRVCTTAALEKDYRQLVVGCRERQWKPKLETITESERKRGKLSGMGGAAGALDGIRQRSKKSYPREVGPPRDRDQRRQQQQQQQQKKQKQKASELPKRKSSPPRRKNKGGN